MSSRTMHSAVLTAPALWLPTPVSSATSSTPPTPSSMSNAQSSHGTAAHVLPTPPNHITIPDSIIDRYHTDYNILYIDQLIKQKLTLEVQELPRLKFQLSHLQLLLQNVANIVAYRTASADIAQLTQRISDIETGVRSDTYLERSRELIEWYRSHHKSLNLVNIHQAKVADDPHLTKRLLVIEEYLEIAGEYLNIQVTRTYESRTNHCHGCGTDLTKATPNMDGEVTCPKPNCRAVHNMETSLRMPEAGDHVANYSSGKDESIENFYKAAQRFQAEQTAHIPPQVYDKLEQYFVRNGCPSAAIVRTQPLNSRGWRGNTSVQMLRNALDDINESALGKHTILIGKNYWNWQPMKISEYMEQITSDYHKTQTVFHTIPVEIRERDSSLGTEYRLWRHLQMRGCQCYFDMFMIAGDDSWVKHENIWKMMCDGANDQDIRFINHKDPLI